jgi:acyl carrier protein
MQPWSAQFESAVRASLLSAAPDLPLASTTTLSVLNLDSLSVMSLVTEIECAFKTTLPPDALARGFDTTLGDIWSYCVGVDARSSAA